MVIPMGSMASGSVRVAGVLYRTNVSLPVQTFPQGRGIQPFETRDHVHWRWGGRMTLLHLAAMPAMARAGLVGLAAAASFAGLTSRGSTPRVPRPAAAPHVVLIHVAPRARHVPCETERIRAMVMAERMRARADVRAQLRADAALARATVRLRRERGAMQVTMTGVPAAAPAAPGPPEVAVLLDDTALMRLDTPPAVAPSGPVQQQASADGGRERGVRVLAALAFFLIGLA